MFIESYQKLDNSLVKGDQNDLVEYDTQVKKLLTEMQETPSLIDIFPSLAQFIEEKNVNKMILTNIEIIETNNKEYG